MKYQINYNDYPLYKVEITDEEKAAKLIKLHMEVYGIHTEEPQIEFFNLVAKYIVQGTEFDFSDFENEGVVIWDVERNDFDVSNVEISNCGTTQCNIALRSGEWAVLSYEESKPMSAAMEKVNWNLKSWPVPNNRMAFIKNLDKFIKENNRVPNVEIDKEWEPMKGLNMELSIILKQK